MPSTITNVAKHTNRFQNELGNVMKLPMQNDAVAAVSTIDSLADRSEVLA